MLFILLLCVRAHTGDNGWKLWLLLICAHATTAYYHGPSRKMITHTNLTADSYFGYSITYQAYSKRLVVGAPKADRLGQVFIFDIESSNGTVTTTPKILFDHVADIKTKTESNNHFLYGAMVKAGLNSFVSCAPKNAELLRGTSTTQTSVLGLCFDNPIYGKQRVLDKDRLSISAKDSVFKPFGWSLDITRDNVVLVGSPGLYRGRLKVVGDNTFTVLQQEEVYYSFGYGVASGRYFDDELTSLYYAVSSPYGKNGTGKVLFWNSKNLDVNEARYTITDSDVGSLFGAALCTVNLNYRRDHLLVGAPTYTKHNVVDRGAVHLYYMEDGVFGLRKTIEGPSDATVYFGYSLANLGDMDGDKTDEVAIGAPYENEGRGAVYVYSGSGLRDPNKNGNQMLIQKIQPEPSDGIISFGLSLTAVQDYDENGCNELAVGAPESNFVVVYKCFAYITIVLSPNFNSRIQSEPSKDEDKLVFQSCVDVDFHKTLKEINEKIRVQIKITHPDVWFWTAGSGSTKTKTNTYDEQITVEKKKYCRDIDLAVRKDRNVGEDGSMMSYTITASLIDDARNIPEFDKHRVLLSPESKLFSSDQKPLADCEGTNCEPKLNVKFKSSIRNTFTIGSIPEVSFWFLVGNAPTDTTTALTPCLLVEIKGAPLLRLPQGCFTENRESLVCKPTTVLKPNSTWNTGNITLDTRQLTSKNKDMSVSYTLYSRCSNRTRYVQQDVKPYLLKSDDKGITIESKLDPGGIVDIYAEPSRVRHVYTITNAGPTTWENVSISFVLTKIARVVTYENIIIEVDDERQSTCSISEVETKELTAICNYVQLRKGKAVNVIVPFVASAYDDGNDVETQNVTTAMFLHLTRTKKSSATTQLYFKTSVVPLWIIITASLVGLFILILVGYALFSLGFLKRQKKLKLRQLKKSVYRQSMIRNSMRISRRDGDAQDALINNPTGEDNIEEILDN